MGAGGVRGKTARKAVWVSRSRAELPAVGKKERKDAKAQRRKGSGSREEIKNSVAFTFKRVADPFYEKTASAVNSVSLRWLVHAGAAE